jgi:hypothetical protein
VVVKGNCIVGLTFIFVITNEVGHLFICLVIVQFLCSNIYSIPLHIFSWLYFHYCIVRDFFGGLWVWTQGLKPARQALYHLSYSTSFFCVGYFQDRISQTICLGWPWVAILLISASLVARIIGKPPVPACIVRIFYTLLNSRPSALEFLKTL